ncbi:MAG: sigma factor [Verrucomicrobiales bacterium]
MLQPDADPRALTPEAGAFATTRWSLVLEAADPRGEGAAAALESLCKAYWYPLYAFARRSGHSPDDSQDLTQAFFAQFLARRALAEVDQRKGRFRTFLLRCMKNHMTSEWRKGNTLRRGGGVTLLPLDAKDAERRYQEEPASPDATPEPPTTSGGRMPSSVRCSPASAANTSARASPSTRSRSSSSAAGARSALPMSPPSWAPRPARSKPPPTGCAADTGKSSATKSPRPSAIPARSTTRSGTCSR